MKWNKTVISFLAGSIVISAALALWLSHLGRPPSQVVQYTIIFLLFLVIPIVGAARSLKVKEADTRSELQKRRLFILRLMILFIVAPLLGGLIYYLTYPSISIAMPLAVGVLVLASLFFFLVK